MNKIKIHKEIGDLKNYFDLDKLDKICDEIDKLDNGKEFIKELFEILETHPDEDFGSPGHIVHTLEKYYKNGYEEKLLDSINRQPTIHTIWMLNRVANGAQGPEKNMYIELMHELAENEKLDSYIRDEAKEFLEA